MSETAVHPLWGSLALDRAGETSLQDQLVQFFREAILAGRLPAGRRVPSTRQLASEHGISRTTVVEAYERLSAEGYLVSKQGAGIFVCTTLPEDYLLRDTSEPDLQPPIVAPADESVVSPKMHRLPLAPGMPALDHFPWADWARVAAQVYRSRPVQALGYGDPSGEVELRQAIVEYVGAARGISCGADQVIIVSSSKHGVELAARTLASPGDKVWFEEPGHAVARDVLIAAGLHIVPTPVDERGMIVSEAMRYAPSARLALVTPSHQFPLGSTMSLDRRLELLQWASANGSWIIEDDHDGEYRYSGRPLAPLHTLDRANRVIYVGSFSNLLAPGLRMGYIIVPRRIASAFRWMRASLVPILSQLIVARFISSGRLASHLRRMRTLYESRRSALVSALHAQAAGILEIQETPQAGMRLVTSLLTEQDDVPAARRALAAGLFVGALSSYYSGPERKRGFVMGFASTPAEEMIPAVKKLVRAVIGTP